jgi:hypothetical protein
MVTLSKAGISLYPHQTADPMSSDSAKVKFSKLYRRSAYVSARVKLLIVSKVSEAIPVTGHGGPYSCEKSRLPHFLDNQLIDGGQVVSLTHQQAALYPQDDTWYSFLSEAESTPGPQCSWKD